MTDEGSESSCEEICSLEAPGSSSSSSKTNSDSGIATDPCGASGGQGSLSSLSNDEADKESKPLPIEVDSPTVEAKEETAIIEVQESSPVKEEEHVPTEVLSSAPVTVEPILQTTESTVETIEPTATPCEAAVEESEEPVYETVESISETFIDKPVQVVETAEEVFQEALQQVIENSNEVEVILQEIETTAEAIEAESDDEYENQENICSSDESTIPCTADDHSISESQMDEEVVCKQSENSVECRIHEQDSTEEDKTITGFNDVGMYDLNHLELESVPEPPPIAPPRRKKSAKVAEKLATRLTDEIVTDAVSCAAEQRWPITSAVTKWLEDSGDEIEEAEEATGQKNGEGNPFPAPFHSGSGTRVASNEWHNRRMREMCDPIASVNKYYRLALPMKTGPGPFPCGVCCIIQ